MMIRKVFFFILIFSQAVSANPHLETPLSQYIKSYTTEMYVDRDSEFYELSLQQQVIAQVQTYESFYFGPQDNGTYDPRSAEWRAQQTVRANEAQKLVAELLQMRTVDLNLFTLEMMRRYLEEPKSRPAMLEVFNAFSNLEFNQAQLNAYDASHDMRHTGGWGFVSGVTAAAVLCIFRPGGCGRLLAKSNITKKAQKKLASTELTWKAQRETARNLRKNKGRTLDEIIREMDGRVGIGPGVKKAETVGAREAKKGLFRRHLELTMTERIMDSGAILAVGIPGSAAFIGGQSLINMATDKTLEFEKIDPYALELKYYGALAVLESTCMAKHMSFKEDVEYEDLRDFILDTREELLLLGQASGSMDVYDKTVIEFARPLPDTDEVLIEVPVASHYEDTSPVKKPYIESFTMRCPDVKYMGETLHSSLSELESTLNSLLQKAIELAPINSKASMTNEASLLQPIEE